MRFGGLLNRIINASKLFLCIPMLRALTDTELDVKKLLRHLLFSQKHQRKLTAQAFDECTVGGSEHMFASCVMAS